MHLTTARLPLLLALGVLFAGSVAFAQIQDITFPINELGGCSSKEACKTYCDSGEHADACISFGERSGLMSHEEAERARTFSHQTGPGGCRGSECRAYCEESAHFDECVKFAEEHDLVPPGGVHPDIKVHEPQIDEDRAMRIVEERGGPGGCTSKDECRSYCSDESHIDQCLAFAKEHKLMSEEDIARAEKFVHQTGPGGCKGEMCKTFCENPDHAGECITFAEENGFIAHEEAEKARAFAGKTGPGSCRGEECRTYCEDPAHHEVCVRFAIDNGLISKEDLERMRQHQNGFDDRGEFTGSGLCSGPEECRAYCENNPDECRAFGRGQGPDHAVGQERAIERRGFEIPPGLMERCKEHPEACRKHFEGQSSGPMQEFMQMGEGEQRGRMNQFLEQPELKMSPGEYQQPYEGQYQYQQSTQYQPPPSEYHPPEGSYQPRPEGTYQSSGENQTYTPPPPTSEPASGPTSSNFVASVFWIFAQLLGSR